MIDGYMCTLVYALLPNKREDTYRRFFELVQGAGDTHNIEVKPAIIMMDFEMAAKRGVRIVFPDVVVKGCYFHYSQCVWRKVQACGLATEFRDNDAFRTLARRAGVLPLVPMPLVEDVWFHALESNDDDSTPVVRFKDYVTEQWVEGDKPMWNHYDNDGPRTTNHVEGWHNKVNGLLTHPHPNVYKVMELFRKEQAVNEVRLLQYAKGGKRRPKKRLYRVIEERLGHLKQRLESGEVDVMEYADAASHLIKLGP